MAEQIPLTEPRRIPSRDEMNLAEFPLTVLSTRANPTQKTLEFTDSIRSKSGEIVRRHWIVTGADKFGLPTASDDEVLLGLMKLSVSTGLNERKVYFTRYELLKILRWTTEGRSYQRLQNAFDRLSGVRIKATNAFYDNESKSHSTRNFGIIDNYEINHGGDSNSKPSFFLWNEVLFKSFQAGFIKKLDLDFFLSLRSAVSKRLYRFLDKHFWWRSRLQINLFTLAHEKVGVSRNYRYASSLRQQLDPAVEELIEAGFLTSCEYVGRGSATEVIFQAAARMPRAGAPQVQTKDAQRLADDEADQETNGAGQGELAGALMEALTARGLKEAQAEKLVLRRTADEQRRMARIVEYYDALVASNSRHVSRSPVGFLYRAMENPSAFSLPAEKKQPRQTQLNFQQGRSVAAPVEQRQKLEAQYLVAKRDKARQLKSETEPILLERIRSEIEIGLAKLRGKISEAGFAETVEHGVEEKLLKLFAFPSFDEWRRRSQ